MPQPSPAPSGPKEKPKQMILTDDLRAHIGDVLACDLELEQPQFPKVLAPPRSRGKPEDMQKLLDFLHRSVHDACVNRKTTIATLTDWITTLREKGIEENDRIVNDQDAGRSSNPEQQPKYIKIWADLMLRYKDQKDEAVKITRYNRVPDHLVGKVELLKCNSAFLPDPRSVGQGAGKEDQAEASKTIQKRKQEALERQLEEKDDAIAGKTREHLETRKRVGNGEAGREKLLEGMVGLVQAQQQTAQANSARLALEEMNALSARLDKYMEYLINPHIPAELKANYQIMAINLQRKLHAADNAVAPPSGSLFQTPSPPTPVPTMPLLTSPVAAARRSLGRDLSSGASTASDDVEEFGILPL